MPEIPLSDLGIREVETEAWPEPESPAGHQLMSEVQSWFSRASDWQSPFTDCATLILMPDQGRQLAGCAASLFGPEFRTYVWSGTELARHVLDGAASMTQLAEAIAQLQQAVLVIDGAFSALLRLHDQIAEEQLAQLVDDFGLNFLSRITLVRGLNETAKELLKRQVLVIFTDTTQALLIATALSRWEQKWWADRLNPKWPDCPIASWHGNRITSGGDCLPADWERASDPSPDWPYVLSPTPIDAGDGGHDMSREAAELERLIGFANQPGASGYDSIYDQINNLCGSVTGDAALKVLRTCLQPLDETAQSSHSDLLQHLIPMFLGLARLSQDEARQWVNRWRSTPNPYIREYIVEYFDPPMTKVRRALDELYAAGLGEHDDGIPVEVQKLGNACQKYPEAAGAHINEIGQLLRHPSPAVREGVLRIIDIASEPWSQLVPGIVDALTDPGPYVCIVAVRALRDVSFGRPELLGALEVAVTHAVRLRDEDVMNTPQELDVFDQSSLAQVVLEAAIGVIYFAADGRLQEDDVRDFLVKADDMWMRGGMDTRLGSEYATVNWQKVDRTPHHLGRWMLDWLRADPPLPLDVLTGRFAQDHLKDSLCYQGELLYSRLM